MAKNRPKVGIGFLIIKNKTHVLLGLRKTSHGAGEFAVPGGHMENGETFSQTVMRELLEEAGPDIKVTEPQFLCLTNLTKYLPAHYIDIGMVSEWKSGEPQVMEPRKNKSWKWYPINELPVPLFGAELNYFEAYKTGRTLFL